MADFEQAFMPMLKHEGFPGYVNDPNDHGGETIAGISRKYWPGASVWVLVDAMKSRPDFPQCLKRSAELLPLVKDFYRRNFWHIDFTSLKSQELATWLFDKRVNMGLKQPIKFLQRALGLSDDGIFGPLTLSGANSYEPQANLLEVVRGQARDFYNELADNDPTQRKFLKGWLARC